MVQIKLFSDLDVAKIFKYFKTVLSM